MKTNKIIKISTIVLICAIITIASIFGMYKLKDYKIINIIPDYILGMEFTNSRVIDLSPSVEKIIYDSEGNEITEQDPEVEYTEENGYKLVENKINPDENSTKENYKKTKKILKNRIKKLGADQYKINLDKSNGNIKIRIPENDNTDNLIYNLLESGKIEIKDSETKEVLIDSNKFKKADVVYSYPQNAGETQTTIFLQIKFDKEGTNKLEDLSKIYIEKITEKTNENGETEQIDESKKVEIYYCGEVIGEPLALEKIVLNKMLYIGIGGGSDSKVLQQYTDIAEEMAAVLNSGILPLEYSEINNHVEIANITKQQKNIAIYAAATFIASMTIFFVIKLKAKGILAAVLQIGYIALLLLVLRYTNVKITIEGIFGIVISTILNYIYIYKIFKNTELDFIKDITKNYALKLIPLYVIAIILSFNRIANIYSLGMTLVWGIIVMYLYNLILTRISINTIKE